MRKKVISTAVLSEARTKLCDRAVLAGKGQLLLSASVVLASLKAAASSIRIQIWGDT